MSQESTSIETLRSRVDRLEQRLGAGDRPITNELMGLYWALVARFEIDLPNERDRLLARGGALMLIKATNHGDLDEE
jgi:hypothetical protein